jgi:uncharacterized protein YukE
MHATVIERLHEARAQEVETKLFRAQSFFSGLTADEVKWMRRDPQLSQHMRRLARELQTLASACGPEAVSLREADREV